MSNQMIARALCKAEELGLTLGFGILEEAQSFEKNQDFFQEENHVSEQLKTTCQQAVELLQENKFLKLAEQLHKACRELCPASFSN